jgi:hypothetical protein
MPFSEGAEPAGLAPQLAPELQVTAPAPPFGKLFQAAVERDNPYVSTIEAARQPAAAPFDANYDPFKNIQGYEDYASSFVGANSDDDVLHVKTRIDSERRRSDLLASGGWRGTVAAIGAGLADPLMLLPIGGELVAVTRAGRLVEGALRTGATFGGLTAAQEAVLGSTQITRPFGESAANVATSTLLGSVLGGALGAWGGPITRDVAASAMRAGETFDRELGGNVLPFGPVRSVIDTGTERTIISGSREALRTEIRVPDPITAFHGSPKDDLLHLDRVFIGRGEGNQTYGHGLYLAEEPEVASVYQRTLAAGSESRGALYEVRFHADTLLDLDAPLAQQPASVQAAIAKAAEGMPRRGLREPGATLRPVWLERALNPDSTGESVYRALSRALGGDEQASQALARSGIQGLQYFDEGSRKAGAGSRNYVVFDDARIELVSKNGEPIRPTAPERSVAGGGSVGAAVPRDTTLEQETIANALGVDRALAFSSPTLRLGTSPSVETRRIGLQLADQPLDLRGNAEGIATPISVEQIVKQAQAPLAEALVDLDDAFVKYRLGRNRRPLDLAGIGVRDLVRTPAGAMSYDEFREAVGKAMRRGDASDIPEVAQAATALRSKVFDPLKDKAIAAGLLPEDVSVDTALSYLTRVYNAQRIAAQRPQFERILTDWLGSIKGEVADRVAEMQTKLSSALSRREAIETDLPLKRSRLGEVGPASEKSAGEFQKLDRSLKQADRQHRRLFKAQQSAEDRLAKFTPTPDLEVDNPLVRALGDLRRGTNREPERLAQFLRRNGGLKDEAGELRSLDLDKAYRGLVRKDGQSLDDAALRAWEEGFFPDHAERPTINDLLDALGEDSRNLPRYSQKDIGAVEYHEYLGQLRREMDERGIGLDRPDAQIAAKLSEGDAAHFRANTPAARAKAREIAFNARRAAREAAAAAERVKGLQTEWDRVRPIAHDSASEAAALKGEIATLEKELAGHVSRGERLESAIEAQRVFAGMDDVELQDVARQITDTLLHAAPNRTTYLPVPLARGPLRERTLSIPDRLIEDFLESDVQRIARVYTHTMAADVELTRAFGRADMEQQLDKVREHYAQLREGVTDERELKKLDKSMRDDLRDLAAVRDRIRGTYGLPQEPNGLWNRAFHVVRDLNYLRLLGGMTVSAFPDLGRTVMVHGLMRVAGNGIVPMLRDFHQFRLAANEVKLAGNALDMVLDTRAMSIADMLDDYGRWSKYERGIKAMTERFGVVSLMAPWNAALKQFVGVISQTRSLQAIERTVAGGAVGQAERTRLASLGIGADVAERIDAMFKAHGSKDGGTWWANTARWEDTAAAEAFRAAMSKEVDIAIVTPGQERPLWMTRGIGRVVSQFRSFTVASTQRVLMTGLQKRDMATLNGVILMTGLGTLSWWLKQQANPNTKPLPDPSTAAGAAYWLRNGIDQAGLVGWLFDAHNIVEKATRGAVGLHKVIGGPEMSRYASRGVLESLLGPTVGFGEGAMQAIGAAGAREWTQADTTAVRRMVPFQNLIGVRHLFDLAEHGLNQSLGVHETAH